MSAFAPADPVFLRLLEALVALLGRLGAWLCLAMAALVCAIVILRRVAETGGIALQEGVIYLHATAVSAALAYTWQTGGHVQVDVLSRRFSPAGSHWLRVLGTLLLALPTALWLLASSLPYAAASWGMLEGSADPGGIPAVYLLKSLIPLSAALLVIQAVAHLIRDLAALTFLERAA